MNEINVGDAVTFLDELQRPRTGTVTRIIPRGEFSRNKEAVSIKANDPLDYGWYVRVMDDVKRASPKADPS